MTPLFAAFGSLFAGELSNRFGRRAIIIVSSIVFTGGAIVCGVATSKIVLLVGRVLLGAAIGEETNNDDRRRLSTLQASHQWSCLFMQVAGRPKYFCTENSRHNKSCDDD